MDILIGILEQGFIYGILALGVYITYSILDFPDLSVDGTFPMGAAVAAVLGSVEGRYRVFMVTPHKDKHDRGG